MCSSIGCREEETRGEGKERRKRGRENFLKKTTAAAGEAVGHERKTTTLITGRG